MLSLTIPALIAALQAGAAPFGPTALSCDGQAAPLAASATPRLAWRIESADRDLHQVAWQVLVASEVHLLEPLRAGLGICLPSLNGRAVGARPLDPTWTAFEKRVFFSTYDVTAELKLGENCLGLELGNGWYRPLPLRMWGRLNLTRYRHRHAAASKGPNSKAAARP